MEANNTIAFSKKHGSFIKNDVTGTITPMRRNGLSHEFSVWVQRTQAEITAKPTEIKNSFAVIDPEVENGDYEDLMSGFTRLVSQT